MADRGFSTLTARRTDATNLPFANREFDGVTLLEVLEHIPDAHDWPAVATYVRPGHDRTRPHWFHGQPVVVNGLTGK